MLRLVSRSNGRPRHCQYWACFIHMELSVSVTGSAKKFVQSNAAAAAVAAAVVVADDEDCSSHRDSRGESCWGQACVKFWCWLIPWRGWDCASCSPCGVYKLPSGGPRARTSNDGRATSSDSGCTTGSATTSDVSGSGWLDYTVQDGDTVRSIAARFDVTPSRLKKFNRMTLDFVYPGQVIMIPLGSDSNAAAAFAAAGGGPVGPRKKPESKSHKDPMLPVTVALSESEEAALDLQCLEMFIKVPARHITDSHGIVPGMLLVTPNGVMFDPDPTVANDSDIAENVFASMKMISSATAYRDVAPSSPSLTRLTAAACQPHRPPRADPCAASTPGLVTPVDVWSAASLVKPASLPSPSSSPEKELVGSTGRAVGATAAQSSAAPGAGLTPECGQLANDGAAAELDSAAEQDHPVLASRSQVDATVYVGPAAGGGRASDTQPSSPAPSTPAVRNDGKAGSVPQSAGLSEPATEPDEFFLCLRASVATSSSSIALDNEQYNQRKKPEHWFLLTDGQKLESIYSFILKWKPDTGECHHSLNGFGHSAVNVPTSVPAWQQMLLDVILNVGTLGSPLKRPCRLRKEWEVTSNAEVRVTSTLMDAEKDLPVPATDVPSAFLTESQRRQLAQALPYRIEGNDWCLVYSTEAHGFSLSQLYLRMRDLQDSPVLLVLQDTSGTVFGALTSCPLAVSDHFYGTGESFLFTFADRFRVYPWTGENNLFIRSSIDNLWIGTGKGTFGLLLDGDLCQGRTQHCKTYNNDPLTGAGEDFVLKHLEAWCFFT